MVYDRQHYFSRFLKYEFKDLFSFDVYINLKKFDDNVDVYSVILFAIYSEEEFVDLLRIYRRGVPLIISTFDQKIKSKLEKIDDVLVFDSNKLRTEMKVELQSYFNFL